MAAVGTTSVSVTTGSTTIAAANITRHSLIVTNPGTATETVHLSEGQTAVVGSGIPLDPGDSYIVSRDTDRDSAFIGLLTGIVSSGSETVAVSELDFDDIDIFRA